MIRALQRERYTGLQTSVEAVSNKSNPCVAKGSKLGETAFASERSLSALSAGPISDGPSICQSQRESCQVRGYPHSHTSLEEKFAARSKESKQHNSSRSVLLQQINLATCLKPDW